MSGKSHLPAGDYLRTDKCDRVSNEITSKETEAYLILS